MQVKALQGVGFQPLQNVFYYNRVRNCRSLGLYLGHKPQPKVCNFDRLCTNCWGRRVTAATYNQCYNFFEAQSDKFGDGFQLLTFCRHTFTTRKTYMKRPEFIRRARADMSYERNMLNNHGAFVLVTIVPYAKSILVRRRGLLIVTNGSISTKQLPPESDQPYPARWQLWPATRASLVDAVARVTRYPARLLTCPAQELSKWLTDLGPETDGHGKQIRAAHRMREFYGCLRGFSSKPKAAQKKIKPLRLTAEIVARAPKPM